MKSSITTFLFICLLGIVSHAEKQESIANEFDGLGGNAILLERARALNPEITETVVQPRTVSRRHRFEIAPEYSGSFGGDTYSRTQSMAFNIHYHINPRWSLGLKAGMSANRLTQEGEAMVDRAYQDYLKNPKNPEFPLPEMDYQKAESMALVNWYPIYGKLNFLDRKVVQFDTYLTIGAGTVTLKSGITESQQMGGGVGFWFTPKFSTRFEMRYQTYEAKYLTGPQKLDLAIASVQMGWML